MTKVATRDGYDFYIQSNIGDQEFLYNIVPEGSTTPEGGYRNMNYIERIKHCRFPDRYQRVKET